MKKLKKISMYSIISILVFLVVLIISTHFISFEYSREKIDERFNKISTNYKIDTLNFEGRNIEFLTAGDTSKPLIVFVHGSPGDFTSWLSYLSNKKILNKFRVMAFNRLGYEKNTKRKPEPSLKKQALLIENILNKINYSKKCILVGHSYGAPVIIKYNILFPQKVDKLVLIGASVSAKLEPDKWYYKLLAKKSFRWIIPEMMDVSNREILPLKNELLKMKSKVKNINSSILIMHGKKDALVPFENVGYIEKEFTNAKISKNIWENNGHLFIFTDKQKTITNILKFLSDSN